ncbi:MAG: tetratricopeptide repeat protein [Candidatus Hydrogenedentes bacterium]|nr:tetratricopeptide repeat protein [Candidatus Hydrogenedentota bacterium]
MPQFLLAGFGLLLAIQSLVTAQPEAFPDRDAAIRARFEAILESNPFQGQAFERLAAGHITGAGLEAWADRLAALPPAFSGRVVLARVRERQFRIAEAIRLLEEARSLAPPSGELLQMLGRLYQQAHKPLEAETVLSEALPFLLDPEARTAVLRMLGVIQSESGRAEEALATWESLLGEGQPDRYAFLDAAELYLQHGHTEAALATYEKLLAAFPDDVTLQCRTRSTMASSLLKLERPEEAFANLMKAFSLISPDHWFYAKLTEQWVELARSSSDASSMIESLRQDPALGLLEEPRLQLLAQAYAALGRTEDALAAYASLLERDPANVLLLEARLKLQEAAKDLSGRLATLQRLREIVPGNTDYIYQLGIGLLEAGNNAEALAAWQTLSEGDTDGTREALLAGWLREKELLEEAKAALRRAVQKDDRPEWRFQLAQLEFETGNRDVALTLWKEQLGPEAPAAALAEVSAIFKNHDMNDEALALMRTAVERAPEDAALRLTLADQLREGGLAEESLPHYERVAREGQIPYQIESADKGRIAVLESLNRLESTLEEERQALPGMGFEERFAFGRLLYQAGRRTEAVTLWEQQLAERSDYSPLLRSLAEAYARQKEYSKSIALYTQLMEKEPARANAWLQALVDLYLASGAQGEAVATAERLARQFNEDERIALQLVNLYESLGRPEDALQQLRRIVRVHPDDPALLLALAGALADRQQWGEANETYRRLLARAGGKELRTQALDGLAQVYRAQDRFEALLAEFEPLKKGASATLQDYLDCATVQRIAGDYPAAVQTLETALQETGETPELLEEIIYTAHQGEMLEKVVQYFARLNAQHAPSAADYEHLGATYARMGDLDKARETWEKMTTTGEDAAAIHIRQAKLFRQNQLIEESLSAMEKALDITPHDHELRLAYASSLAEAGHTAEATAALQRVLDLGAGPGLEASEPEENDAQKADAGPGHAFSLYRFSENYRGQSVPTRGKMTYELFRMRALVQMAQIARSTDAGDSIVADVLARLEADPADELRYRDAILVLRQLDRGGEALSVARRLLALQPEAVELTESVAALQAIEGHIPEAIALLEGLLQAHPEHTLRVQAELLPLLLREKQFDRAAPIAETLLAQIEGDAAFLSQMIALADTHDRAGYLDGVETQIIRMPGDKALPLLAQAAQVRRKQGQLDRARFLYEQALFATDNADLLNSSAYGGLPLYVAQPQVQQGLGLNIVQLSNRVQQYTGAVSHYRQHAFDELMKLAGNEEERTRLLQTLDEEALRWSAAETPEQRARAFSMLRIYLTHLAGRGEYAAVLQTLEKVQSGEAVSNLALANMELIALESMMNYEAMEERYESIARRFPAVENECREAAISILLAQQQWDAALEAIHTAMEAHPDARMVLQYAQRLAAINRVQDALQILERLHERGQGTPESLRMAGQFYRQRENFGQAIAVARAAWQLEQRAARAPAATAANADPSREDATLRFWMDTARQAGQMEAMLEEFRGYVEEEPQAIALQLQLAQLQEWNNAPALAIATLDRITTQRAYYLPAWQRKAALLERSGDLQGALQSLETLADLDPRRRRELQWDMRRLYARLGDAASVQRIEDAIIAGTSGADAMVTLANRFQNEHNYEKTLLLLEKALQLEPDRHYLYDQVARLHLEHGRLDQALAAYTTWFDRLPSGFSPQINTYQLEHIVHVFASSNAMEALQRWLEKQKGAASQEENRLLLESEIYKQQREYQKAFDLLLPAIANASTPYLLDQLLSVAEIARDSAAWLPQIESAVQDNAIQDWRRMALLYARHNNPQKAREALEKAQEVFSSYHDIAQQLRQLMELNLADAAMELYRASMPRLDTMLQAQFNRWLLENYDTSPKVRGLVAEFVAAPADHESFFRTLATYHGLNNADKWALLNQAAPALIPVAEVQQALIEQLVEAQQWREAAERLEALPPSSQKRALQARFLQGLGWANAWDAFLAYWSRWEELRDDPQINLLYMNLLTQWNHTQGILDLEAALLPRLGESARLIYLPETLSKKYQLGLRDYADRQLDSLQPFSANPGLSNRLLIQLGEAGYAERLADLLSKQHALDSYLLSNPNLARTLMEYRGVDYYFQQVVFTLRASTQPAAQNPMVRLLVDTLRQAGLFQLFLDYLQAQGFDIERQSIASLTGDAPRVAAVDRVDAADQPAPAQPLESFATAYQQAQTLFNSGKAQEALDHCASITPITRQQTELILSLRASALEQLGKPVEALALLQDYLKTTWSNNLMEQLAATLLAQGRHSEGIALMEEYARTSRLTPEEYAALFKARIEIGDIGAALETAEQLSLQSIVSLWPWLQESKRYDTAVALFETASNRWASAGIFQCLAQAVMALSTQPVELRPVIERAYAKLSRTEWENFNAALATLIREQDRFDPLLADFLASPHPALSDALLFAMTQRSNETPNPETVTALFNALELPRCAFYPALANLLRATGSLEAAQRLYTAQLEDAFSSAEIQVEIIRACLDIGATTAVDAFIARKSGTPAILRLVRMNLLYHLWSNKQFGQADAIMLAADPWLSPTHKAFWGAMRQAVTGEADAAIETLSALLDAADLTGLPREGMGFIDNLPVLSPLQGRVLALQAQPGNPMGSRKHALARLIPLSLEQGQPGSALRYYAQLAALEPDAARPFREQIVFSAPPESFPELQAALEKLVTENPAANVASELAAIVYEFAERMDQAPPLESWLAALGLHPLEAHQVRQWTAALQDWQIGPATPIATGTETPAISGAVLAWQQGGERPAEVDAWKPVNRKDALALVDIGRTLGLEAGQPRNDAVLAASTLDSVEARTQTFSISGGKAQKIWVNGELALELPQQAPPVFDGHRFEAALRPGVNHILVQSISLGGDWLLAVSPVPLLASPTGS